MMRSVLENGLHRGSLPVKLWYAGPFFRAERPQQGRYRQLQQVGGRGDRESMIRPGRRGHRHRRRGVSAGWDRWGTSSMCPRSAAGRAGLATARHCKSSWPVCHWMSPRPSAPGSILCVLDDKRPDVQSLLEGAPLPPDHLCDDCREHFAGQQAPTALGVRFTLNPRLVRGLDYYTRTTFEFDHPALGAQSGIGGGGRYDGLMESPADRTCPASASAWAPTAHRSPARPRVCTPGISVQSTCSWCPR